MAAHLTPEELADEMELHRYEIIARCMELGVPIFQGKIDKSLFRAADKATVSTVAERELEAVLQP